MFCIVGGSGFIGTALCQILEAQELNFIIIDKVISKAFPSKTIIADVCDIEELMEVIPDGATLVNLAAEHRDDVSPPSLYYQVNVRGAQNICEVATQKNISKILYTSSVAVYAPSSEPLTTTSRLEPSHDYGRSKLKSELVYKEWQQAHPSARSLLIVRPTVIFGPGNRGNVYNLIKQIQSRFFVMIGSGHNRKSMGYVDNLASFIFFINKKLDGFQLVNYADTPDLTMEELVEFIRYELGMSGQTKLRVPYWAGVFLGAMCSALGYITGRKLCQFG